MHLYGNMLYYKTVIILRYHPSRLRDRRRFPFNRSDVILRILDRSANKRSKTHFRGQNVNVNGSRKVFATMWHHKCQQLNGNINTSTNISSNRPVVPVNNQVSLSVNPVKTNNKATKQAPTKPAST